MKTSKRIARLIGRGTLGTICPFLCIWPVLTAFVIGCGMAAMRLFPVDTAKDSPFCCIYGYGGITPGKDGLVVL